MNLIIWIIVGSLAGAVSYAIQALPKQAAQRTEPLLNIITGAIGALVGGSLLAPIFGNGNINAHHYTNGKLLVAIASATFLLIVINAFDVFNKKH